MFPLGPEGRPEPDIIGTASADRARPRWRRYAAAGGVLALAGIIAATAISSPGHHSAAPRPSGAALGSGAAQPVGVSASPAGPVPPAPDAVPSQAWVTSLDIANWPMPGSGSVAGLFAGGVAGSQGWMLTVRNVARPGERCTAAVVLSDPSARSIADAYLTSPRPASRTPVGDLTFISLGPRSPGVGVGFLQVSSPATEAWVDPARIGGFEIVVPVLAERACGQRYYLAGFAYPLAGTLDVFLARGSSASAVHYLVPTRLSRPKVPRVWQSAG